MSSSVSYSDRLSDMPDEILLHILSFLPTPESVRTSVLSPRWRHLWRFVSAFHFDIKDPSRPGKVYQLEAVASEAVEKINQFIALRDAARSLLRFHLHIDCHFLYHKDPVSNWIRYAGSHGVRDMAVNIYRMSNPPPLSAFFGPPSVEALDLRHHTYHPSSMFPHHIQPSKLKALTLRLPSAAFADKCLEALLASCPDLQELTLHCGVSDKVVEITAPNLCRLSIIDDYCHCHQDSYLVKINCPTLEYLHLSSWVHLKRFQGKIPSLHEASMDLSYNAPHTTEQFPQILANFCTVTKLTLRLRPGIEVKVNPWYLVKRMNHFPIFRKLKHFKFIAEFGEDYIKHILLCFLMNSPNLSSIQLIGEPEGYLRFISKARERLRISAPLKVLDHLKIVSVRGISDEVKRSEVLKMLSKHVNEWERVVVIT